MVITKSRDAKGNVVYWSLQLMCLPHYQSILHEHNFTKKLSMLSLTDSSDLAIYFWIYWNLSTWILILQITIFICCPFQQLFLHSVLEIRWMQKISMVTAITTKSLEVSHISYFFKQFYCVVLAGLELIM
jgi:hypothetical protein